MSRYYDTYEQETLWTLNTRTGVKKKQATNYSSYWMDFDDDEYTTSTIKDDFINPERIVKLASVRRAIANFVRILTNDETIEVAFSSGKDSYTDGKRVVIAAEDDSKHFDSMVGLALHEGSHCLLSDFNMLEHLITEKNWEQCYIALSPELRGLLHSDYQIDYNRNDIGLNKIRLQVLAMQKMLGVIMNVIEDRRIDSYVYKNASGYRPYYDAMYTKYFFNTEVTKNLKHNPSWRTPTFQNYTNWLINIFHPNFDRNALPGLSKMVGMIDLKNIRRFDITKRMPERFAEWSFSLTNSPWQDWYLNGGSKSYSGGPSYASLLNYEVLPSLWTVANDVLYEIMKHIGDYEQQMQKDKSDTSTQTVQIQMDGVQFDMNLDGLENLDIDNTQSSVVPGKFNEKKALDAMKKMEQVMRGQNRRKKLKAKERTDIQHLESADAKIVEAGDKIVGMFPCLVTRKINKQIMLSEFFPFSHVTHHKGEKVLYSAERNQNAVVSGVRMGQILVHRLQVRNDPVVTTFTRQDHGRIDRRILAQLGMDIESVFKRTTVENFKPAMLHLSLDASGSMGGRKWEQCITVATALSYVASKIRNIEVVVTIRGDSEIPMVAVVHDSRVDNFQKVRNLFPSLCPTGSTPEGLCFNATLDLITECSGEYDTYFINFSDGEPGTSVRRGGEYRSYSGEEAFNHTRRQVQAMRDAGVKVMSYFISEYVTSRPHSYSHTAFKKMYGENAVFVNVQNVTEVLRTMNNLLLKKS